MQQQIPFPTETTSSTPEEQTAEQFLAIDQTSIEEAIAAQQTAKQHFTTVQTSLDSAIMLEQEAEQHSTLTLKPT
jgi:hypothetical protein